MADNYLENRMEEYRSGRLASRNRSTAAMRSPRRTDALSLRFPPMWVAITTDVVDTLVTETVNAFAAVGLHVVFTAEASTEATELARRSGSRFYPGPFTLEAIIADMTSRPGGRAPRVVIDFHSGQQNRNSQVCHIDAARWRARTDVSPAIIARHLLYLTHPENAFLL